MSSARGVGSVIYDGTSADYTIYVLGLDLGPWTAQASQTPGDTTDDVTDAHFHNAATGVPGGVVFGWKSNDLDDFTATLQVDGWWRSMASGRRPIANPITPFQSMFAGATQGSSIALYANLHTTSHDKVRRCGREPAFNPKRTFKAP